MSAGQRPHARRDAAVTAISLLLLLLWEWTGWDRAVAHGFGGVHGFGWRDAWLTSTLLHDGGRALAWTLLALLAFDALRPAAAQTAAPARRERLRWLAVVVTCLLLVPALKRLSATSCPWDLAEFGGAAVYVPHWRFGVADGGGGHCFPSGHAVAAFAFFGTFFLWRPHRPRRARRWLAGVLAAGALFGGAQLVRGAHFPSHTLWSAWLCWALCVVAAHAPRLQPRSTASTSEWNSRRYSTQTTTAVAATKAHGEKNQAVAANAK